MKNVSKEISVREWIRKFNNGDYNDGSFETQVNAGWYDWFCDDDELSERLKKMGNIINKITNDFILDNYYVWFKNNCPASDHPLYDDFRFEPLYDYDKNRDTYYFGVTCDDKRRKFKYDVFTARSGYETEFMTDEEDDLIEWINNFKIEEN